MVNGAAIMSDNNFRPIRYFSLILIAIGIVCVVMNYGLDGSPDYTIEFKVFVLVVAMIHFFIGISVYTKLKVGFYTFKCYLYLIYIAFPVGTLIARKTLKYMDDKGMKNNFT